MLRRVLDSPLFYFGSAVLLVLIAIASQFEIRRPSRPVEPPSALYSLRERDDLNVVFVLIDTLRADRPKASAMLAEIPSAERLIWEV